MSMSVDGGAGRAQPAATPPATQPTTTPAEAKKSEAAGGTQPQPKAPEATPKAPADGYQQAEAPKEEPVQLEGGRSAIGGEEIPMALRSSEWSGDTTLAATDFENPETGTTGGAGTENPQINVADVNDATFQQVNGTPFIQGAGDGNAVHWNDIQQGALGDCYYMSSLGSVAQANPELIQNAIRDNGDGTYTVRLYEREGSGPLGVGGLFGSYNYNPVEITVTPDFPMRNGQPVFAGMTDSNGDQRELWPAIMEKAFAQQRGSYGAISGGNAATAMEMLTGQPSSSVSASSVTLDQLDRALQGGQAIVADSLQNGGKKDAYANGTLVGSHSYMLTGVDRANGTVTLRNPWGPGTPDITMSIADFNRNFNDVNFNPTR